jgi:hypothetical protein
MFSVVAYVRTVFSAIESAQSWWEKNNVNRWSKERTLPLHQRKEAPIYSQLSFKARRKQRRMGSCYLDFEVYSATRLPVRRKQRIFCTLIASPGRVTNGQLADYLILYYCIFFFHASTWFSSLEDSVLILIHYNKVYSFGRTSLL